VSSGLFHSPQHPAHLAAGLQPTGLKILPPIAAQCLGVLECHSLEAFFIDINNTGFWLLGQEILILIWNLNLGM